MPPKKAAKRTKGTSKEEKGSASAAEPSVLKRRKVAEKDEPIVTKRKRPPVVKKKAQEKAEAKSQPPRQAPERVLDETYILDSVLETGHHSYGHAPGVVMVMGQGDVGQLGLGESVMERRRPCKVGGSLNGVRLVQVECGGMHTVALSSNGKVFTWGCNDEGALGRDGDEFDSAVVPSLSDVKVVQVSAGDSHTAALTDNGDVYCWGVFRDSSGAFGLLHNTSSPTPELVYSSSIFSSSSSNKAVKVVSGADHVAILTDEGAVYTFGCAEQGQLGRVPERFAHRGSRRGLSHLLTPATVYFKSTGKKKTMISDIFCGSYVTFAIEKDTHQVYGWGLNNYHQVEPSDTVARYHPYKLDHKISHNDKTVTYSGGEHHTIMCCSGVVKVVGRKEYGRVGLGENAEEPTKLTPLRQLEGVKTVASGGSCSFAVTRKGEAYSWGMGTNMQLGSGEEEDRWVPGKVSGKQLEGRKVISVSVGGQHTALLVAIETDGE